MYCCRIESRDQMFLKSYDFLPFANYISKNIGQNNEKKSNTVKNSDKYNWKRIDHAKKSAVHSLKIA